MRVADEALGDRGAGLTHVSIPSAPDDVHRYQVEGEAQPRIVIDPRTGAIYVGNGVVYPTTPLGGGGGVPIALSDEGGLVEASLTSLNLVGAGAVATSTGVGAVQLTISGTDRGTLAGRPAASTAVAHMLYVATDVSLIYYCDGAAWFIITFDHGNSLTGLGDDDHPQYHTDARGDLRYQPLDTDLTQIAAVATQAYGRSVLAVANAAALQTLAGLVIGTNVQAWSAVLDNMAALVDLPVADGGTGASTAVNARANLGLTIGTNVQAWDTDLDAWALRTPPTGSVVGTTDTQTLSNKRRTPRTSSPGSSATPMSAVNTDSFDVVDITGLAVAITSMTPSSGTPVLGDALLIRIKDNGTARAIAWGASYAAMGVALPTTTVVSKQLTVLFIYTGTVWGCVSSAQEA